MPEATRAWRRVGAIAAWVVTAILVASLPAAAQDAGGDEDPVDLGVYGAPLRFEAPEGAVIELESGRRLLDTVEFRPSPHGGTIVIAEMDLDTYVAGIAEMPARWPLEALKAQAVAARTYAWYQATLGTYEARGLHYDICATTSCQVFRGHSVVEEPVTGARWQRAVDETSNEVLLHDGGPILARYFSTSGGQTRDNEDIFPSSGSFPYLKGIEDPDDAVSPLHTWRVRFTRAQFDDLLSRGETLSVTVPIEDVRMDKQEGGTADRVVVTGQDGTTAEVTAGELRDFLDDVAPEVFPDDFPGRRPDGGNMPSTVPSSRYTFEVTDDHVVLDGSGWGHGVGMGQYGAKGKAERGVTYGEILSTYYNGVTPTTTEAAPDRVRVGLADDVNQLSLSADGPVTVRAGDEVLTRRGFGTWTVQASAEATMRLVAPPGYGSPLVAEPTTATRSRPFPVETVGLETVVNKPAELVVEVRDDDGVVGRRSVGVVDRGRHQARWSLQTEDGRLPAGSYQVALVAVDEDGTEAGTPVDIEVVEANGAPMESVLATRDPLRAPSRPPIAVALAAAVGGALAGALASTRVTARP